jgi:hypothetical protein
MTRSLFAWCWLGCLLVSGDHLLAQAVTPPGAPEEMKQLEFLAGEWEGIGTLQRGPGQSSESQVHESASFKLQGSVLLIEGRGTVTSEAGIETIVHDAMAVISFDRKAKAFRLQTWRAGGETLEPAIEVGDRSIIWSFQDERAGTIRFTVRITDDGQWHETGEASRDGKNWFRFLEMNLVRADRTDSGEDHDSAPLR